MMRVLHINYGINGGAALCAIRINTALVKCGIESRMLFAEGEKLPNDIEGAIAKQDKNFWYINPVLGKIKHLLMRTPWFWDKEKIDTLMSKQRKLANKPIFLTGPYSYYKNLAYHPLVQWADVIHLHWVPDFIDYPSFFAHVRKPIVWTLHDKLPAVGIQHYCSAFHPVPEELIEIDSFCRKVKRKAVLKAFNLNIVAISEQMTEICKNSDVLKGFPITLIHNGVNTKIFKPYDRSECRKILNLPKDGLIFLFSAYDLLDDNKGLFLALDSLIKLNQSNITFVCVGKNDSKLSTITSNFPIIKTGLLNDENILAQYYSASNFFLQCSKEETFGQTPLEAMSCGIPVISTPCSGASDLIRPFNGVISDGYDANTFVAAIRQACISFYDPANIREYIETNFHYNIIAKQYCQLYKSILTES